MILAGMAENGTSFVKVQKNLQGFMTVLKFAACELLLNFLLLLDAIFSYLLTKFARHCKLQIPCILCSRLDHLLGNEKPGFYRNLLCSNHRSEISSLFSCCIHGKLADGRGMCEECLLSFAMKTKSNPEMHRLLVGKFGYDLSAYGSQSSLPNREIVSGSMGVRLCSCCNKPWRSRPNVDKLLLLKSLRSEKTMPTIPLSRCLTHHEGLKKMRERFSGSATPCSLRKTVFDPLSHVGYMKLKLASDSESEFPFYSDDEGSSIVPEIKEPKEESKFQHAREILPKTPTNCVAPDKLMYNSYKPQMQPDVRKPQDVKCFQSDSDIDRGLGELNWQQADQKTYPSIPELISLDDFPPLSNGMEASAAVSTEKCELKFPLSEKSNPSALSELMSLVDSPSSFNVVEGPFEALQWKFGTGKDNIRNISINKHGEILKSVAATAGRNVKNDQVVNEVPYINPTYMNQGYVCKFIVSSKEEEASGFVEKEPTLKEPERVNEDKRLLPIENTSAQGLGLSSDKTIPSTQVHDDELQINEASSSDVVQMLQDTAPIERTESSGLESLDATSVSEIEGENIVDRLKRQVEFDRRCINALYKELDEERNAAAIAANQAMAMITRLQEEKASLHMEALHYLRMMEEQAEYDVEALEKANNLLAEKEKDIQDLEADLEFFRLNFPDEPVETIAEGTCGMKGENPNSENTSISFAKYDVNIPPSSIFMEVSNDQENSIDVRPLWSEFEDEKLFLSKCLKDLGRKFCQFSQQEALTYISDGHSEETVERGVNKGESLEKQETQINGETKENSSSLQKDIAVSNGSLPAHEKSNAQNDEDQIAGNERNHPVSSGQKFSKQCKKIDLFTLENEISDLNERLEALESDWNFLVHTFNSLQTGKEGLNYVKEIAQELQELRKTMTRNRRQFIP
ncbi:myosin-binding protein 2 isoform X2 [Hevea brasiliensis]|uniref:myosin-binding protein 2 isoform X2 n=1 Tax=Hevea brasiliensis TaxID=3981 RepID=UPI0025FE7AE5|nr:myosin-binding protein 2 isoform X2 [Hevea brasiliensis]